MISHNIRGLNIPEKRVSLLRELKKGRLQFVFLQETHFRTKFLNLLTRFSLQPTMQLMTLQKLNSNL